MLRHTTRVVDAVRMLKRRLRLHRPHVASHFINTEKPSISRRRRRGLRGRRIDIDTRQNAGRQAICFAKETHNGRHVQCS